MDVMINQITIGYHETSPGRAGVESGYDST